MTGEFISAADLLYFFRYNLTSIIGLKKMFLCRRVYGKKWKDVEKDLGRMALRKFNIIK